MKVIRGKVSVGESIRKLDFGNVYEVLEWPGRSDMVGRAIQRSYDRVVVIGIIGGFSWEDVKHDDSIRIRLLEEGDSIVM